MKKTFTKTALISLALLCLIIPHNAQSNAIKAADMMTDISESADPMEIYSKTLRLRIIANSDSLPDQALKLHIRNELLKETSDLFLKCENAEQAKRAFELTREVTQARITNILEKNLAPYGASMSLSREEFPEKTYDGIVFPAGSYLCVKVVLGRGEGRNWWCVMYPPLCIVNAKEDEASKEYCEESGRALEIRWRVENIINDSFDIDKLKSALAELCENGLFEEYR
ncbi:MAG: stage II sporulation protein R [Eubacteriaceae bacterium]|nr:stage II sporulation protein R [Eubacteriaceae bacterium]